MSKLDLKQTYKTLYNPSTKAFSLVDVPPLNFLLVDGRGDPNHAPEYAAAVEALYAMAYGLKFKLKKQQGIDYTVMPLEGLWWTPDMKLFSTQRKDEWLWMMMIAQPEMVTAEQVTETVAEVRQKKTLPALDLLRFAPYHEGLAAQIMYIGAYADEGPTIAKLHDFIQAQGYTLTGKHHEIYLGDPRRTAPDKLKTIIRQPCQK